jgi:hypothetical protein
MYRHKFWLQTPKIAFFETAQRRKRCGLTLLLKAVLASGLESSTKNGLAWLLEEHWAARSGSGLKT